MNSQDKSINPEQQRVDIKEQLEKTKQEFNEIGGVESLKSGEWLNILIHKSFATYWKNANVEYFESKYGTKDKDKIAKKLISVASKNASILGGLTGATMSTNELVAFFTAGEGGIGIPANIAIAVASIGSEIISLTRIQLQLIANLGKLYKVPLDPDDPEDILTILAFAVGGSASEATGKFGMKIGGKLASNTAKNIFKKETLKALKRVGQKIGIKILQKSIVKYTAPLVSIALGASWNYISTKTIAKIAIKHFEQRAKENA